METQRQPVTSAIRVTAVAPFFAVDDVDALASFLHDAFGGVREREMRSDDGVLRHATFLLGGTRLLLSKGVGLYSDRPLTLQLSVPDTHAAFERALKHGADVIERPGDQFYGERRAAVRDRWGNVWWLSQVIERVGGEELKRRERAFRAARSQKH